MSEKVKVTNLVKTFGDNEVLKGINLTVENNEVVVIIGPSGSGKSTLLRNLNKLEEPTSGSIVIDNVDIAKDGVDINSVRENIGMVFQHFNLFKNLTVGENIMLAPVELKKSQRTMLPKKLVSYWPQLVWKKSLMRPFNPSPVVSSNGLRLPVRWQ